MTDVGAMATKKKSSRRLPPGDSDYRPAYIPPACRRSPYPSRPVEARTSKEEEERTEVSGSTGSGVELGTELVEEVESSVEREMARREESELSVLLKYMIEKDEKWKEGERERRREEEEMRRESRREEEERLRGLRREEEERHRERERVRERELEKRREEDEARRQEEYLRRERKELLQEKLKSMGSYKVGTELADYIDKFERVMKESGVEEDTWSERLFPRLPERLCARVNSAREEGGCYEEVKKDFTEVCR